MELQGEDAERLTRYLEHFTPLIGDARTKEVFQGTVKGIIGAQSLVCAQIAAHSPELAASANGEQRIRRMVSGETTQRSTLDDRALTERLRERGIEQLEGEEEVWVMVDGSDLRKPYARRMEGLMRVRKLDGEGLTNGYRTLNAIGIGRARRGILYHRLFSSKEKEFVSEPHEVQQALQTIIAATRSLGARIIYGLDSGFDDIAVWGTIWGAEQHMVCRLCHLDRIVEQEVEGSCQRVSVEQAANQVQDWAVVETEMVVQKGKQPCPKRQKIKACVSACPVRVTYNEEARTKAKGRRREKEVWVVRVVLRGLDWEPWWLLTDLPVVDADSATQVFSLYRQRWAVEDAFKVSKECLGWEEVQVLDLEAIRNLVALSWVAVGFLYELGVTFQWPEVRLLARLGGWEARKDPQRRPGKIVLTRGLRRLLDMAATQAILADEIATYGRIPPRLAALIGRSSTS
jgi:hypothetical protein